jgi:hypothetical protein
VTVLPTGMISLTDALERLVAAIHGDWAVAPIENHQILAGETFKDGNKDDAPEIQMAVSTFERDGHKTTGTEDEIRWKNATERLSVALADRTLTAQVEFKGRRYDVQRNYWDAFEGEKLFKERLIDPKDKNSKIDKLTGLEVFTFQSGKYRANPEDTERLSFDGMSVFINKATFNNWLVIKTGSKNVVLPRRGSPENQAKQANKYQRIIDYARITWPNSSAPGYVQMAEFIISDGKSEGLGQVSIRKLLAGKYSPALAKGISGY